jgi:hypothetical protein
MFTISFANLNLALCSVKQVTLKEHMSGECPNFSNHAGTQGLNDVGRSYAQRVSSQIISTILKSRNERGCFPRFCTYFQRCANEKMIYSEAPLIFLSNSSRINEFEDPCKELW